MNNRSNRRSSSTDARCGYTLVEMVAALTILAIIGLSSSYVILESAKVYARAAPGLDSAYQARLAAERIKREVRDLDTTDSITVFTATALTFDDSSGTTIAYALTGSDLTRNGDLLAQGVTALTFSYWKRDGTTAILAANLALVEMDLTVETRSEAYRVQSAVFPRVLAP